MPLLKNLTHWNHLSKFRIKVQLSGKLKTFWGAKTPFRTMKSFDTIHTLEAFNHDGTSIKA